MSRRCCIRLLIPAFFLIMVVVLYTILDSISENIDHSKNVDEKWIHEHLELLEDSIQDLDQDIKNFRRQKSKSNIETTKKLIIDNKANTVLFTAKNKNQQCIWRDSLSMNTTFNSRQLYDNLPFDNPNNDRWAENFDVTNDPLKVILMPYSHVDSGWLNTFEQYYYYIVHRILKALIKTMDKNENYKFIWAEISFLSLWWNKATKPERELLKKFLHNKQLEIVTGGWVMSDEATTHYSSMLDQLIEGHQFIENKLGNITIQSSLANDPFGHSPTMAYLLKRSDIRYMAIHRVHYHIKKHLAIEKRLEFSWQQSWDRKKSTRIFTHLFPYHGYDIPYTCGPDPKLCCQYDFARGMPSEQTCTWGIQPILITEANIHKRAELILDQYRKKAQLYKTNVLLIPLGDDFRYRSTNETEKQFSNYDRLIKYINNRTDWNTHIQYGTLTDYFEQVVKAKPLEEFPTYAGDFFTYADRDNSYWSGYYSSRMFFKRMNRIAESYLRSAEILFSIVYKEVQQGKITSIFPWEDQFLKLTVARRNLGLFQHHDAVTGTARNNVVNDYASKLSAVIGISQIIMQESAAYLLYQNMYTIEHQFLIFNEESPTADSFAIKRLIKLSPNRVLYIYNPTDQRRIDIIKVLVDTYQVRVTSNQKSIKHCQIDPNWSHKRSNTINSNQFELLILIDIPPYTIKEYTIHTTTTERSCPLTTIQYLDEKQMPKSLSKPFKIEFINEKFVDIDNRFLTITFAKSGALLNLQHKRFNGKLRLHTDIIHYGTTKKSDNHSGAYLFIPDGDAQYTPMRDYDSIRIQRGPLVTRVIINHKLYGLQYKLTNTNGSNDHLIHISTITHLTTNKDTELALRLSTSIKNQGEFFTDLNGFQMIRRKNYDKLPIQGNVYPMSTMAYLEDESMRLTVLSGQSSGVASLKLGVIDVFLDRRLMRDDGRGLGQGITDNRETINTFRLLFEPRHRIPDRTSLTGYPTLLAHHLSIEFLYPLHVLHLLITQLMFSQINLFLTKDIFPGDYHLVNLRTLSTNNSDNEQDNPSNNVALILQRFAYDCEKNYEKFFHFEQPTIKNFFKQAQIKSFKQTSLTLRSIKQRLNSTSKLVVPFGELVAYKISFTNAHK